MLNSGAKLEEEADADLDLAEIGVLAGIFAAAGQTCVAGSRAYIHSSVYDQMIERLVQELQLLAAKQSAFVKPGN